MSKMKHKPKKQDEVVEPNASAHELLEEVAQQVDGYADAMRDTPLTANGIERGKIEFENSGDLDAQAQQRTPVAERESLAKVMTNAETPRCPFCSSVKLEEMPMVNWLRWRCIDCRKQFRAPAKGKAA